MTRTKAFPHELIGESVEVVEATNKSLVQLKGTIVDETKNTITLDVGGAQKRVLKRGIVIKLLRTNLLVKGDELLRRPEDRLKG